MLIRLSLKNWMSFRDEVVFSMIASRERRHGERVPKLEKYHARVLPVAAIYGGNASGKTNLFKALHFAKRFVVRGANPDAMIPVQSFKLDAESAAKPSSFRFEILADGEIYEFFFSVTVSAVTEEKLVQVLPASEKTLYHRKGGTLAECAPALKDQRLQFVFDGTRDNQLFLTNSVMQKLDYFRPVYDWFRSTLELVAPDSRFEPFEQFLDESSPLYSKMNNVLSRMDTGISHVGSKTIPFENVPIPPPVKEMLRERLKDGMSLRMQSDDDAARFVVTRKNGELTAKKLVSYHQKTDGTETAFEIEEESDGSKRAIDLLPAFLDLSRGGKKEKVYVIDEVDRSLHSLLTRELVEAYLASCGSDSRSQLLMTTHDVLLMDQELFRRDEMWLTERNQDGFSSLTSLCEFKDVRYDKDVRKSYLQGRLGGIPKILLGGYSRGASDEEDAR